MKADAFPIRLTPPPFFLDHHVARRPVLPAVEAMESLAAHVARRFRPCDHRRLSDLRFDKFLHLDTEAYRTAANRVQPNADGSLTAALTTRFSRPGATLRRTLEHVSMTLGRSLPAVPPPSLEVAASLAGVCTRVNPQHIYSALVPFGPAYRNIDGELLISADGALARVRSPRTGDPRADLVLGSPYVLDAAFHAACVWCQRFRGSVAFPVAMHQRHVIRPTRLDETYTARILPRQTDAPPFVFDIFILDDSGRLREAVGGVQMRDVSGGRTQPPKEFVQPPAPNPLTPLETAAAGMVILERRAVAPFAGIALSVNEARRMAPMTADRAGGYLSARLALKRLNRRLSGDDDPREARAIETVADDPALPRCTLRDGTRLCCSVAHDRRFTIAVGARTPVGVDVEPRSDKARAAMHLFLDADEQAVLQGSSLEPADGALRAWSAKEAAAKALGLRLADAWSRIRVKTLADGHSVLVQDGGAGLKVLHADMQGHLFTLLVVENRP